MYHGQFIYTYQCFKCNRTYINKTLWRKHLEHSHQILVELQDATKHVLKKRNTKKSSSSSFQKKLTQSYLIRPVFFAVIDDHVQRKNNIKKKKAFTCDIIVDGVVCGKTIHGSSNMLPHKRNKHTKEDDN